MKEQRCSQVCEVEMPPNICAAVLQTEEFIQLCSRTRKQSAHLSTASQKTANTFTLSVFDI